MVVDIYNTNKKYNIIYADPPWTYKTYSKKGQNTKTGSVLAHYNTMSLEELKKLGETIKNISAEESILFMWVTFPTIEQAFEVIKAWGFTYKTCAFCWVKQNVKSNKLYSGIGHWTNSNAEICLLATKKKFPKRQAKNVKQIILSHREEHSKKPNEIRERIVQLVGDIPKIELFARQEVDGWDCWGNEVGGEDE